MQIVTKIFCDNILSVLDGENTVDVDLGIGVCDGPGFYGLRLCDFKVVPNGT